MTCKQVLNMTQPAVYAETKTLSTPTHFSFVVIDTCNHTVLSRRTIMQYLEIPAPIILTGMMQDLYLLSVEVCLPATWAEACRISYIHHSS